MLDKFPKLICYSSKTKKEIIELIKHNNIKDKAFQTNKSININKSIASINNVMNPNHKNLVGAPHQKRYLSADEIKKSNYNPNNNKRRNNNLINSDLNIPKKVHNETIKQAVIIPIVTKNKKKGKKRRKKLY